MDWVQKCFTWTNLIKMMMVCVIFSPSIDYASAAPTGDSSFKVTIEVDQSLALSMSGDAYSISDVIRTVDYEMGIVSYTVIDS